MIESPLVAAQSTDLPSSFMVAQGEIGGPALITHVKRGEESPVRVVLDARVGNQLWVRPLQDGEPQPDPIPFDPATEELVPFTPVSVAALHTTSEVGRIDDLVVWAPVIEVRRDEKAVYVRTLRPGEEPATQPVRWPWDRALTFEVGSFEVSIELIESQTDANEDGYVPLTGVLWAWLSLGSNAALDHGYRYLLAAARRLDASQRQFREVKALLDTFGGGIAGPAHRAPFFAMVGTVETAVVALGRAADMAIRLRQLVGVATPVPGELTACAPKLTTIRNAYEHIEDRALGQVQRVHHPDALTIFDYRALVEQRVITYAQDRLDLEWRFQS